MSGHGDAPRLEVVLGLGLLCAYAVLIPASAPEPVAAAEMARAIGLEPGAAADPAGVLSLHTALLLPAGAMGWRASLFASIGAALGAALAVAWSRHVLDESPHPVGPLLRTTAILPSVVGVAFTRTLCAGHGVTAGALSGAALTITGLVLLLSILQRPGERRSGLALAVVAGLCAGAPPAAGSLLWPPTALACIWALRRGSRWPLLAPFAFLAGCAISLTALAGAHWLGLRGILTMATRPLRVFAAFDLHATVDELESVAGQLGVICLLIAGLGMLRLLLGRRGVFVVCAWTIVLGVVLLALGAPGDRNGALPILLLALTAPMTAGIVHLATRFGRARLHAGIVLGVLTIAWPAVDGIAWLRARSAKIAASSTVLDHKLATAAPRARLTVPPDLAGWLQLARAIGARPDLRIETSRQ